MPNLRSSPVRTRPGARLAATLTPAAGITFGLFLVMAGLIATEFQPVEAAETRTIDIITPQAEDEPLKTKYVKPQKLAQLSAPPPLPKLNSIKSEVILPTPDLSGKAPTTIKRTKIPPFKAPIAAIPDTDAKPIRPPIVQYPARAITLGLEGDCQVYLNVDVRGRPYDVRADCTDSVFETAAVKAVRSVEFAPKIVSGIAKERANVIYPLVFTFDD